MTMNLNLLLALTPSAMTDVELNTYIDDLREEEGMGETDLEEAKLETVLDDARGERFRRQEKAKKLRMAKYNAILETCKRANGHFPIVNGRLVLEAQVLYAAPPSDEQGDDYGWKDAPQGDPTGRMLIYVRDEKGQRIDSFYGNEGSEHVRACHSYQHEPRDDDYQHVDLSMEE